MVDEVVEYVINSLIKEDYIDCDALSEIIKKLASVRKAASNDWETLKKENSKENNKRKAEEAKKYIILLKKGDTVSFDENGKVITGVVGEQKYGAKTLHLIVDDKNKYIKYHKVIIPEGFKI